MCIIIIRYSPKLQILLENIHGRLYIRGCSLTVIDVYEIVKTVKLPVHPSDETRIAYYYFSAHIQQHPFLTCKLLTVSLKWEESYF